MVKLDHAVRKNKEYIVLVTPFAMVTADYIFLLFF